MSFRFDIVAVPDVPPFACTCRIGSGPFVKTRQLVDGGVGELFICKDCVVKLVALYDVVPVSEFEAQKEQLQIAIADRLFLQTEFDRVSKELASGELERLRVTLDEKTQECEAESRARITAERENARLQSGDAAGLHRAAVAEVITAALAPAITTTKGKAA